MGREVGGGIGMGTTCEPKAFSFQCMTEFTTNKNKWKKKKKGTQLLMPSGAQGSQEVLSLGEDSKEGNNCG